MPTASPTRGVLAPRTALRRGPSAWLYISAYATIAGAELNAELERQTALDTTAGRPQPMGERDAYAADTVGESRSR